MLDADTTELFDRVARLVEQEIGIRVHGRYDLIASRVGTVAPDLVRRALGGDPTAVATLVARFCTHETRFFREPVHFEHIETVAAESIQTARNEGRRDQRIFAWSVACSSGEEPYSLAMTLLDRFPRSHGWEVRVLATDVSESVLAKARAGTYSLSDAEGITPLRLKQYMLRGQGPARGTMRVGPELRRSVRFAALNLMRRPYALSQRFEIVMCRNVLIYFDDAMQRAIVSEIIPHLAPKGMLYTGHSESAAGHVPGLTALGPAIFQRAEGWA